MAKTPFFGRNSKLLSLASAVASKEVALKITKTLQRATKHEAAQKLIRTQQARIITKNLAQLKGAAMKAGQLLSIDSSQFLPPEAIEILSQLQSMAEPEDFKDILPILKAELGDSLQLIDELNETAFAAASIGQVHAAKHKGKPIAIKVQYPGIEKSIDSDLSALKRIIQLLLIPTNKKLKLDETFNELNEVLKLEANYLHEAKVLQFAHNKLVSDEFFYAPNMFPEISSKKVLSMEFCTGDSLNDWIKTNPSTQEKLKISEKMLDLFMIEFLDWKLVQTDPNFGNYLVQNNPFKVILLDFGSSINFSDEFISEYLSTIRLTSENKKNELLQQAVEFQLLDSKESLEAKDAFYEMMKVSMEPFLSTQQPFDFTSVDYEVRTREAVLNFTKLLRFSPPPRKIIFLHRKLGGLFNLLKRLEVQIDLRPYWQILMKKE